MKLSTPTKSAPRVNDTAELRSEPAYWRQWIIARNVKITRREWLDEMSLAFAHYGESEFQFKNGAVYKLPDVDDVFQGDEDMRWLSLYLECDDTGLTPRRMSHKIERLRLINLFLKIRYPNLRKHLEI